MLQTISLFSGCGGCSLGLQQAGFDVRLAADIDKDACETYANNVGRDGVWNIDLADLTPNDILEQAHLRRSNVDMIVGGPPCQGFSSAGARSWEDQRNVLLRRFVEIVTTIKPTWFIMENVEGLLTAKDGFFFIEAVTRFLEAGYWVRAEKVYLERYGLPQRRKRVILVGNVEGCEYAFPSKTHDERSQPSLFESHPQVSILDAIADLPIPSASGMVQYHQEASNEYSELLRRRDGKLVLHHQAKHVNEVTQERLRLLSAGATMKDLPEHLQHPSFTRRAFRRVMDGTPTEKRGGAPSGLKRLHGSIPSLTITSAAPSEFAHPVQNRLLTLRECARIQSFPDWFEFSGSWSSIATQIGNAIPPLFMQQLAAHIKTVARWQPTNSFTGRWLGIDATKSTGLSPALAGMLQELEERTHLYA